MDVHIRSNHGFIEVDNGVLHVKSFGKILWQSPVEEVIGFNTRVEGILRNVYTLIIYTESGAHEEKMVKKADFEKLQAALPDVPLQDVDPGVRLQAIRRDMRERWYESLIDLTHVGVYTDEKKMQADLEEAYRHGWVIQGQSGQSSHVNVGRSVTKFVLTGGLGMMTGVSRSKDKTTITFVRSPEWLAEHRPS